jgi:hypothetical protein
MKIRAASLLSRRAFLRCAAAACAVGCRRHLPLRRMALADVHRVALWAG